MSRNPDYQFVTTSADELIAQLTAAYQNIVGKTVRPASPEKLFLSWLASGIMHIYENINYAANQNVPSRAIGENLDALAELFYEKKRPAAKPAYVTMQFEISEAQATTIIIPKGTMVTNEDYTPYFETVEDTTIEIGETTTTVQAKCTTPGTVGNGFTAGQISECVNLYPYYESCTNIDTSAGGSDVPDDDEFYELLMASENAWSCAGSRGAYKYFAKSVSTDVEDVVVNSPNPGEVYIYALMNDGTKASSGIKTLINAACNDDEVRPLTDTVAVDDPAETTFNVNLTYYMSTESDKSAAQIQADVNDAINNYILWQSTRLGRDINPSKLIQMVVAAGAKRVEVTAPVFTHLGDGSDNNPPGHAVLGTKTVTNGGYEDE